MTTALRPRRPHPRPSEVVRDALRAYRGQFARVALTAVILYVPIGFFEAYFVDVGEGFYERHETFLAALVLAATLLVTTLGFTGDAFFSGFLDAAVGEEYHGHPHRTIGAILRNLPYRRLIGAAILLGLVTSLGTLALLVPGIVLFTLFCLVGPLINIERLTVRAAFRRSRRLVRHAFFVTALVVTLPLFLEHELVHGLQIWVEHSYVLKAVVDGLLAAGVYSVTGMIEVTLAYELIDLDGASVPRDEPDDGTDAGPDSGHGSRGP